jgi:hypothetical protein
MSFHRSAALQGDEFAEADITAMERNNKTIALFIELFFNRLPFGGMDSAYLGETVDVLLKESGPIQDSDVIVYFSEARA